MNNLVKRFYRTYGLYVNKNRSFPLKDDGCKPVERRVLLSAYEIAKDKLVKSARIDGHSIGHYHPHGSSYGSIVQLVKQGFLTGQGNFGNNLGVDPSPPAAMRYTEAKLSKLSYINSFSLINYVKRVESELDDEPIFLPSLFPICLLGTEYTQGIGFGYRTYIPCYRLDDLKNRLLWLLGVIKEEPIIKPICNSLITSNNETLKKLLTTGKAKIETQGIFEENRRRCIVSIKSWAEGRKFESILKKFSKELNSGDIGYSDLSDGTVGNNIVFEVLKQRNRDKIYASFIKKLKLALKGSISFEIMVSNIDGKVELCSVDNFLLTCYNNYKNVSNDMLNNKLSKVRDSIKENEDLSMLREPLRTFLRYREDKPIEESYELLSELSTLTPDRVKELMNKYRLSKLLTVDTDISKYEETEKLIQHDIKNLNDFVLERYNEV